MAKKKNSTNHRKHPYLIESNWLPGGSLCYWRDAKGRALTENAEEMDAWAYSMQSKLRQGENFLPKSRV
jgi:hypothetical protein